MSTPATASSTPSATSQPIEEAPVLARRFSWCCGGFVTGGVVVGGLVVAGVVVVVVVTGGVVVVVLLVDVGGVVVVVLEVEVDVDVVVVVVVDEGGVVVVDVVVVVLVVVHGVVVVVVGFVVVVGSPLSSGERHPGRSFGHQAAAHTRPSPEAAASGPAPDSPTTVNTTPAARTPM
jgi:hypothetical protein